MSTYFDIVCASCGKTANFTDIRSEEALDTLIGAAEHIHDLIEVGFSLSYGVTYFNGEFVAEHCDHKLVVKCEYESLQEAVARKRAGLSWADFMRSKA